MRVRLICVGKLKEKFYKDAAEEYSKRLGPLLPTEVVELKEEEGPDKLAREAGAILKNKLPGGAFWTLCVEGEMLSSPELAEKIDTLSNRGISHLTMVIGSSEGLAEEIKKASDFRLSMSRMTFPHHLARVMVLEQIYRAAMISGGRKYHK